MSSNNVELLGAILEYVQTNNLKIGQQDENRVQVSFTPAINEEDIWLILSVRSKDVDVCVQGNIRIPASKRMKMAEFFARSNCGISIGGFRLDLREGKIEFRATAFMVGCTRAEMVSLLEFYTTWCMVSWGKYLAGVKKILHEDNVDIKHLVDSIEQEQ